MLKLGEENYTQLSDEISQLQIMIKERRDKRGPYLSSFIDAIENFRKKAVQWFYEETSITNAEIGILERLFPFEDYTDYKLKLENLIKEFSERDRELSEILESVKDEKIKRLRDLIEEKTFGIGEPRFLKIFSEMFSIALKLEELIESLEEIARTVTYTRRLLEIELGRRGLLG